MRIFKNIDCMKGMKEYSDKYFDLAIVDPPYGIDRANNTKSIGKNKSRKNSFCIKTDYNGKKWDSKPPNKKYFDELFRVSKNQIIWGANHFIESITNSNSPCWLIWDKVEQLDTYASGEMAWTSFARPMKIVPLIHSGFRRGAKIGKYSKVKYNIPFSGSMDIHPTQKPIELYVWILKNYAKPGDKILDTHVGSASSLIACEKMGFDYVGFELDPDYYKDAVKRIEEFRIQVDLFEPEQEEI